jgi:hypothetical protein
LLPSFPDEAKNDQTQKKQSDWTQGCDPHGNALLYLPQSLLDTGPALSMDFSEGDRRTIFTRTRRPRPHERPL